MPRQVRLPHARRAAPASRPRRGRKDGAADRIGDYVVRVDPRTGRECPGPIRPPDLLLATHRDAGPAGIALQFLQSRLVDLSGGEWLARRTARAARRLLGGSDGGIRYRFRDGGPATAAARKARTASLRREAAERLAATGHPPRLVLLVTGATGFFGRELLSQLAEDPRVVEVVSLVRPRTVRDPETGAVVRREGPRVRGAALLRELGISRAARRIRFIFVKGDVEEPGLGLAPGVRRRLLREVTHVVHGAASVAFDATFDDSFRANVLGTRHVLAFSREAQRTPGSAFVAHVAIETSYVHGRTGERGAPEGGLEFPAHYYSNYYELTKAMGSLETDRALFDAGLRVVQVLPSIIIGDSRNGNNRGDHKVVNGPVNAFGRIRAALDAAPAGLRDRWGTKVLGWLACAFPADRSAELNLVTVDRVAQGVRAALVTPEAVGARIHLASDRRIRADEMARIVREEVGLGVRMADPTVARLVLRPLRRALLVALGQGRVARSFEKLGAVFSVYTEWGQAVHAVGEDVRVLGLPSRRPDVHRAFRMLCRHNRYVLEFGTVRGEREVARREAVWQRVVDEIEFRAGRPAASLSPPEFRQMLEEHVHLPGFRSRPPRGAA